MEYLQDKNVEVIYQDKWLLVVNKPAGMVTTREKNTQNKSEYLEDWVKINYPNNLQRQGIVHRLDKDTSGLVVVARNAEALKELKSQFSNRSITKKYLALVGGDLPAVGDIKMPIKRSSYVFGKFAVDPEGKFAWTEYKVIKKILLDNKYFSMVEVTLKTGRTHQIRVHFAYMGWPLYGDLRYGGVAGVLKGRQFLHACYLKLRHPNSRLEVSFNSNLPDKLADIINYS